MNKEELINAIEKFLLEKDPKNFYKREDIKKWVNDNYEIEDDKLIQRKIKTNTLSFFYF